MKPVVEYIGRGLLLHGQGTRTSIVQKRDGNTLRNFNDKSELTSFVDSIKPSITVTGYVAVKCSCGHDHEYNTKDDVPAVDVVCTCGRQVITYG